jgi:hypothetical protein
MGERGLDKSADKGGSSSTGLPEWCWDKGDRASWYKTFVVFTASKVGEPVLPPPRISPSSDGGDVKTLELLATELALEFVWDLVRRGLVVGGESVLVLFGGDDTDVSIGRESATGSGERGSINERRFEAIVGRATLFREVEGIDEVAGDSGIGVRLVVSAEFGVVGDTEAL